MIVTINDSMIQRFIDFADFFNIAITYVYGLEGDLKFMFDSSMLYDYVLYTNIGFI